MDPTQTVLLRELRTAWRQVNLLRFGGQLQQPVIELARRDGDLGRWQSGTRVLSLAWRLVVDRPWGEVVAVLEHEVAHQYVDEVLGVRDETAHGPTFRRVCAERGIDARAAGTPEVDPDVETPAVVRRIRKLLALADSPVEAEARAAARLAWRLMLRHNVARADLDAPVEAFVVRGLSEARPRVARHEHLLAGLIAERFFVEVTVVPALVVATARWGRMLEVAGRPDNVEVARWVWDFVLSTAERAWRSAGRPKPKSRFLDGVIVGFREKLGEEAEAVRREEGLVWVGDPALGDFLGRRYPARRQGRRLGLRADDAFQAGQAEGRRITLRRPIRQRGDGVAGALVDRGR